MKTLKYNDRQEILAAVRAAANEFMISQKLANYSTTDWLNGFSLRCTHGKYQHFTLTIPKLALVSATYSEKLERIKALSNFVVRFTFKDGQLKWQSMHGNILEVAILKAIYAQVATAVERQERWEEVKRQVETAT